MSFNVLLDYLFFDYVIQASINFSRETCLFNPRIIEAVVSLSSRDGQNATSILYGWIISNIRLISSIQFLLYEGNFSVAIYKHNILPGICY